MLRIYRNIFRIFAVVMVNILSMNKQTGNIVVLNGHYHITSDDKINVGDWFFCSDRTNYAHVFRCIGITDDTHLQVSNISGIGCTGRNNGQDYGDWDICYSHKIVASTYPYGDNVMTMDSYKERYRGTEVLLDFIHADSFNL